MKCVKSKWVISTENRNDVNCRLIYNIPDYNLTYKLI